MNHKPQYRALVLRVSLLLGTVVLASSPSFSQSQSQSAHPNPNPSANGAQTAPSSPAVQRQASSSPIEIPAEATPLSADSLTPPVHVRRVRAHRPPSPSVPSRSARRSHPSGPQSRVGAANDAARIEPHGDAFDNAIQRYAYADGALYQVYTSLGNITDIALEDGEKLVGSGPVAAGDTVRWIIGDTTSGAGANERVHILVKPTRSDLATNLIINTDRRTYHLELRANPKTYMASVSWHYPETALIALRTSQRAAENAAPVASDIDLTALNFGYQILGDTPAWRPVRVFDDGTRTFVAFPQSITQGEMPPIFVISASGVVELVNYRVSGHHLIVDRLFDVAELRLGDKKSEQRVRIIRGDDKARNKSSRKASR